MVIIKGMKQVGKIPHYYGKIEVAIIELSDSLSVGDQIKIEHKNGSGFGQVVDSMQVEHAQVNNATKGDAVGIKVIDKAEEGDIVFKE